MGSVESGGALTASAGVNGGAYQGQEPGERRQCGHGSELDSGWPALGSSCMSLVSAHLGWVLGSPPQIQG